MATAATLVAVPPFLLAVLIIIMSPAPVADAAAERANHTCGCIGYSNSCVDCDAGRCCSPWGYCGTSFGYCEPCYCDDGYVCDPCYCLGTCLLHAAVENQPLPSAAVATYDPNLNNVSVATDPSSSSSVGSATATLICSGPSSSSTTVSTNIIVPGGQCLQVTNPKNGKQAMVRIINRKYCSNNSLALDHDAFQQIEDDDAAAAAHLPVQVSYKYTHCVDN